MKDKGKQKALRLTRERHKQAQDTALVEQQARAWKRRATFLGLALIVSIGLVIPFLEGHALHRYFGSAGKAFLLTSMCLLSAFMYAAGTAYILHAYHRALRRIHQDRR